MKNQGLYECQECGEMTLDKGICFMCKETIIRPNSANDMKDFNGEMIEVNLED